jgi:uncharacterized membrane protein YgcG
MKTLTKTALCLTLSLGLLTLTPGMANAFEDGSGDPTTITNYEATYNIQSDGTLNVDETLQTDVTTPDRHGIFQFFDITDPSNPNVRYVPTIDSVTRDGVAEHSETSWQNGRTIVVLKIGSATTLLDTGAHTYDIKYTIKGVISPNPDTKSPNKAAFNWNIVQRGWLMDILKSHVVVNLPQTAQGADCKEVGYGASPCTLTGKGAKQVIVDTGSIKAGSGIALLVTMEGPPPGQVTVPWGANLDMFLGSNVILLVIILLLILGLGYLGFHFARQAREDEPGMPVQYAPPDKLPPAQVAYILEETTNDKALTATLLYLAEQKLVTLTQQDKKSWLITGSGSVDAWNKIDHISRHVGQTLGVNSPGVTFQAHKDPQVGQTFQTVKTQMAIDLGEWARDQQLLENAPKETLHKRLAQGSLVLLALFIFATLKVSVNLPVVYFLLPLAYPIGGIALFKPGVGTRRSERGRTLWSQAGGFKRLLTTESSEDRFDYSAQKDLWTSYIPYATIFGSADLWAKKYQVATGQTPPTPMWYPYPIAYGMMSGGSFDSFGDTLDSAISSYSSSSGSGGGFGGGGGGGGGGGSW